MSAFDLLAGQCLLCPSDSDHRADITFLLMEWSGRALAPLAIEAGKGRQRHGARHVSDRPAATAVIGIDIGKYSFHSRRPR